MAGTGIHFDEASAPQGMRVYAIGDVHGRLDLLAAMHGHIAAELDADRPADWRVVHLGDYVDRGPDSKGVLDFLVAAKAREPRHLMLAGNHDAGLLEFLARPDPHGVFMNYGGIETAKSYGVGLRRKGFPWSTDRALREGHAALAAAVPPAHVEFLRALPCSVEFGDFFFCHAGIRPGIPLAGQLPSDLLWIRGEFHGHAGLHPKVIVHGHTPVAQPDIRANRANIDTGAYRTGMLCALAIEGGSKRLLGATETGVFQRSVTVTP